MIMKVKLTLALLLTSSGLSFAQMKDFDVNGYVKYLFSSSKSPFSQERYYDHLIHARLNTGWYPAENFKAIMQMRLRGYYGQSVENTPDFLEEVKGKYDFLNLDAELWKGNKTAGLAEVDRLYIDWNYKKLQLTLGRQRIAWGTSWVWNPIDIFNPLSVLDFDYEERPAVDAIRAQYYTGPVSKVELAFKPAKEKNGVIAAGLLSFNKWDYDFNFIGGNKAGKWFSGAGWAGDISGAGFRGEILLSQGQKVSLPSGTGFFGQEGAVYSLVLSGDYTFTNSFYIHTEILHNSTGVSSLTALYQKAAQNLGMLTAARWSLYQEFAYDFHPLVRGGVFGLFNPDDRSFAMVPSVTYSAAENLDLLLLVMFFNGNPASEFGSYGSTIFLRLKYSF